MRELALAAVLAGCTLAPRYERPAGPVANTFPGDAGALGAADRGWRSVFGDPRLQSLIGLALRNNRDLRIAALDVEATRAQYRIQRSELVPTLGATAIGEISSSDAVPTRYRVGLTAAYELDLFGRIRSLEDAALEEYLASQEAHRAAHLPRWRGRHPVPARTLLRRGAGANKYYYTNTTVIFGRSCLSDNGSNLKFLPPPFHP